MIARRQLLATAPMVAFLSTSWTAFGQTNAAKGGDAIVGIPSAIPSLDIMASSDDVGRSVNLHIYEALVTRDERLQPSACLAESWEVSSDNATYRFRLRSGVRFHNGKEMSADDVKASIDRFRRMAVRKNYLAQIADVVVLDPRTVEVRLSAPQPLFLDNFSQPEVLVAIIPAEDGDKDAGQTSLVGTGPYRLLENVGDSHVKLARFDGYVPDDRHSGPSGYGGRKEALFDTITFRIIPEPSAMVAALEVGEIHFADLVPQYAVPQLKSLSQLEVITRLPTAMNSLTLNFSQPPMNSLEFRQAIAAAIDIDDILEVASDGVYQLNPYWQYPGYPTYPDTVETPFYNIKNKELARELLAKSGYKGEPIIIMSATTYPWNTNTALVLSEQLKAVGINVQIDAMDWPALVAKRGKPEGWHLYPAQFGTGPWLGDPVLSVGALGTATSPNHHQDPSFVSLVKDMQTKPTQEERRDAWLKVQKHMVDQLLAIKLGDIGQSQAHSRKLAGYVPFRTTRLWNVHFA